MERGRERKRDRQRFDVGEICVLVKLSAFKKRIKN
jgi:hypothetical protein